ncbi:MAG: hypothetical protein AB1Z21_04930 [Synechococcaceae cyanobacterium]
MLPRHRAQSRRILLALVLLVGSFQLGRLSERNKIPCRLRPLAPLVEPLLGRRLPSPQLCDLMQRLPSF